MSRALEIAISIADAAEMLMRTENSLNVREAAEEIHALHDPADYSVWDIREALEDQVAEEE